MSTHESADSCPQPSDNLTLAAAYGEQVDHVITWIREFDPVSPDDGESEYAGDPWEDFRELACDGFEALGAFYQDTIIEGCKRVVWELDYHAARRLWTAVPGAGDWADPVPEEEIRESVAWEVYERLIAAAVELDEDDEAIEEELNVGQENGCTPLHLAAERGDILEADHLLESGAEVDIVDDHGWRPLHCAAYNDHVGVLSALLVKGADLNGRVGRDYPVEELEEDARMPEHLGCTPLHLAAECGHEWTVEILAENGGDVNARDARGWTPLHFAARGGHAGTIDKLLERGAEHGVECRKGWKPIDLAITEGEVNVARMLQRHARKCRNEVRALRGLKEKLAAVDADADAEDYAEALKEVGRLAISLSRRVDALAGGNVDAEELEELAAPPKPKKSVGYEETQERLLFDETTDDYEPCGFLPKVAGMHKLKRMLAEDVVKPLENPEPYERYGLSLPNGVLLYGPPGCGKTYITRQLADELGYHYTEIIPSKVASIYIHDTSKLIRDTFKKAQEQSPAILFIDEFESLAPSRGDMWSGSHHRVEEVGELLSHISECAKNEVLLVAATNEPEKIDRAILRAGRFDKIIYVGPPDLTARTEMLRFHVKDRPHFGNMDFGAVAYALAGYSASDLKCLVDEAARAAMKLEALISPRLLNEARKKVPASVGRDLEARYEAFGTRGF